MRADDPFFDTNILIYAFAKHDRRTAIAEGLLAAGGVVGIQTLNEFAAVANKKLGMSWKEVSDSVGLICELCPVQIPLTMSIHRAGLQIAERYRYPIYDSLMLAAALESSCRTFYSEDMSDGQTIGRLAIRNPF